MDTQKRNHYIFQILSYLLLAACLLLTTNYVRLKKFNTISADESSEMLLGSILASENSILSKNWYYSTELEVINTNIYYSFFFHFTDNWHLIRTLSIFSIYVTLLLVYLFFSKVCKISKFFAITAVVMLVPISNDYYHFNLMGGYYFPVIITSFLTLALAEFYLKLSGWKAPALLVFSFIFAILIGLGGMRQLFFTYIPLFVTSGLMLLPGLKKTGNGKWFVFSAVSFAGSMIGWAVNAKVLTKIYNFDTWSEVRFSEFSISRIGEILDGIFISFGRTLGYTTGKLFSDSILNNAVCGCWVLITVVSIWYAVKNRQKISAEYARLTAFTLFSYIFYVVFYSFTTMYHNPRYNISIVCLSFPLAALFLDHVNWKKTVSTGILAGLVLLTVARGMNYYAANRNYDPNVELRRIARELVSQEYYNGYATFWYANNMTEFSNGKLDVWSLIDGSHDIGISLVTDIDQTFKWLQKVSHDTTHPEGKTFLFFTAGEDKNNNWKDQLQNAEVIYSSEKYKVYGFADYEHLIDTLYPGYDFVFGESQWVENGEDVGNHRNLYNGGVSRGPHETFWPGRYEISITGRNLQETDTSVIYGDEDRHISVDSLICEDEFMKYEFELSEKIYDTEILIRNISDAADSVIEIDSLSITRITG